ncbi:MAG TPA: GTPase [candidate division WOR-3 bacterium]|uniref:GTPase n=1 Tax=candidate division WOR-3 bacterium TaxID=2052148 RepID=A0A7V5HP03_UNCW3|nr:GTPase [candidate division WOR-3 bacterium]
MKKKVIIMGAAGRDFHNFNVYFRDNEEFEVVAFTATQIPNIEGRKYPKELAGKLYPNGIPIYPEEELENLIKKHNVDLVVFAYSDVSHEYVMHRASQAMAAGANFMLMGADSTMLKSRKPVIAVCAVRTGSGKSQTTRRVAKILKKLGKKTVVIRHPMPYGDLTKQIVQRFETFEDLDKHNCTIEEREEYEPHLERGNIVYAGVDYGKILEQAEEEADVILWDGGNNDMPFYKPDLLIVVADPHRPYHEVTYHPGETNLRMADVIVINKVETAYPEDIETVRENARASNPDAIILEAASPIFVENSEQIKGKRVLVVEDGPTLTHGEMSYGAGVVAAEKYGARELVDPRPYAVGSIKSTYEKYQQIGALLPAMGYSKEQLQELEETINKTPADLVVVATPINLGKILNLNKPYVRVKYELQEIGRPTLQDIIEKFFRGV